MAPTQVTEDYYEILELSQTADETTIRASYKRLAKLHHPDKCPNDANATARFQVVSPGACIRSTTSQLIDISLL